ncbi:hypothetical protein, partial [Burkholderia sp.]|uniref:hypothetical protein n=1 Tax=Burkholderia sp. TaxID=36773 RepID=UPI00258DB07F
GNWHINRFPFCAAKRLKINIQLTANILNRRYHTQLGYSCIKSMNGIVSLFCRVSFGKHAWSALLFRNAQ